MPDLSHKKALIVIAYQGFQDYEFKVVKDYLSMFGTKIDIASSSLGTATGNSGSHMDVDCLVSDVHPENYDAVIFIGGPGAEEFINNDKAYALVRGAATDCQVLAAICIAPTILAKAGVLKGKKATVWTSETDDSAAERLTHFKAKYEDKDVVIDGNIITGRNPEAADKFARSLVDMLSK